MGTSWVIFIACCILAQSIKGNRLEGVSERAEAIYQHKKQQYRDSKSVFSINQYFGSVGANWPCFYGVEPTGYAHPGNATVSSLYTCGIARISSPCIIYSFHSERHEQASSNDVSQHYRLEMGIQEANPTCEIHVFEPSSVTKAFSWQPASSELVTFHDYNFMDDKNNFALGFVKEAMKRHQHSHVDIVRMTMSPGDVNKIQTHPWPDNVGQILLELYAPLSVGHDYHALAESLERSGFRLFHKQHPTTADPAVTETSWVRNNFHPQLKSYGDNDLKSSHHFTKTLALHHELAEFTYANQKMERGRRGDLNKPIEAFGAYWPCLHGEVALGTIETWKKNWNTYKDGWKFVCGMVPIEHPKSSFKHQIHHHGHHAAMNRRDECIVYSLGSAGNMAFEVGLHRLRPDCRIFILDKDSFEMKPWFTQEEIDAGVATFTHAFISNVTDRTTKPPVITLSDLMESLNHTHIDLLKMDVEGAEFGILTTPTLPPIEQLLVEVHCSNIKQEVCLERYTQLFNNVEAHGLRLFHKEINCRYEVNAVELAFIHKDHHRP